MVFNVEPAAFLINRVDRSFNSVDDIPSALTETAPDEVEKFVLLNDAIPLFDVVASSPEIAPLDISIPSPALNNALVSAESIVIAPVVLL